MRVTTEKISPVIPLSAERIRTALGNSTTNFPIQVFDQLDSTNTFLMQQGGERAPHATCVVAETQISGRGRHGRNWVSSLGGSLTFSLMWRFSLPMPRLEGLSLAIGVAVVRALRELGMQDAQLKWPNDVLHHFHKLAGVLIETGNESVHKSYAVIGIGINIQMPEAAREQIGQAVTDWSGVMQTSIDRNVLLSKLLCHLADVLGQFEQSGLVILRDEWVSYHAYQNKNVRLRWPDNTEVLGRVNGIAENGALLLETNVGEKSFSVGEISLRADVKQ
jgi:BirA family transcriptional regulator, biotin operon repressor / biotin---[acetyl-CoA-carboxylase] ligase